MPSVSDCRDVPAAMAGVDVTAGIVDVAISWGVVASGVVEMGAQEARKVASKITMINWLGFIGSHYSIRVIAHKVPAKLHSKLV